MFYFYVKRKTKLNEEKVGNYIFTKGILSVEDEQVAMKMKNNLCKYYGAIMSDKSLAELKKEKEKKE